MQIPEHYLTKFKVTNKPVEKSRWEYCEDVALLVGKSTIQISSLMKGMSAKQIEDFYNKAKTYTRSDINFWIIWKEHKPQ